MRKNLVDHTKMIIMVEAGLLDDIREPNETMATANASAVGLIPM